MGSFYGITAKEDGDAEIVEIGGAIGFKASSVALRFDGAVISRATAYCMNDEQNWKTKPLFQLASMSQTRANAKVLRNVLAWVVVLAGYRPTPAEEMEGITGKPSIQEPRKKSPEPDQPAGQPDNSISDPQRKRFYAIAKNTKATDDQIKEWLFKKYKIEHSKDIPKNLYDEICEKVKRILVEEPLEGDNAQP